jgi:hypothetical protein
VASGESAFLDASSSGGDVFFLTTGSLVGGDVGSGLKVYDAHECTSASPCPPPAAASPGECTSAASCRAAPMPQPSIFGAPSSATFEGVGNLLAAPPVVAPKPRPLTRAQKLADALKACHHKRSAKQRRACKRLALKHYGPAKVSDINAGRHTR